MFKTNAATIKQPSTPIVLSIAGSDCSAGAGLQADLKTCGAMGVYGMSVVTAVTAQSHERLHTVHVMPADVVEQQLLSISQAYTIKAIKLGMLGSQVVAEVVVAFLRNQVLSGEVLSRQVLNGQAPNRQACPIIVDPVLSASVGGSLFTEGKDFYLQHILPLATLVTPNIPEASRFLGQAEALDHETCEQQARELAALGPEYVLLKGGHGSDERLSTDYLACSQDSSVQAFSAARLKTVHGHGTGCTLATAIAAGLAQNLSMPQAIAAAKNYIQASLLSASRLGIAAQNGPLHHFSSYW